ncbi:hypothetical protein [Rubellicoccus peritrichatus]|uniref:Uncharacterized protein n=1 Tax=Rubellicoccus peritrichatus TaxID=3080537 RepID=A0AAQ3LB16_9BACT|nr:hypothetical protein [Puniceicoccus sp. CR14]WOO40972.1 hypothetical protein RZN69_20325 [Puniceicoccus sp. CR14]
MADKLGSPKPTFFSIPHPNRTAPLGQEASKEKTPFYSKNN